MTRQHPSFQSGITEEKIVRHGDDVIFRTYLADRVGTTAGVVGAEGVFDVTVTLPRPIRLVWPIFKDFNKWMNRYGYTWDGIPADHEDKYLHIANAANQYGAEFTYLIRKVIPEKSIYFDSMPTPIAGRDGSWTGHNVFIFTEEQGKTTMNVFMEHTWYSGSIPIEELRAMARQLMTQDGPELWRKFMIPDLQALVQKA